MAEQNEIKIFIAHRVESADIISMSVHVYQMFLLQ